MLSKRTRNVTSTKEKQLMAQPAGFIIWRRN